MLRRIFTTLILLVTFSVARQAPVATAATGCDGWTSNPGGSPPANRTGNSRCADLQQGDPTIGIPAEWQRVWIICDPSTQVKIWGPQVFNDNQVSSATCPTGLHVTSFYYQTGFSG